jgi:hypothetical protein
MCAVSLSYPSGMGGALDDQGLGQRDTLLLAAGKLMRTPRVQPDEVHAGERQLDRFSDLLAGAPLHRSP